MDVDSEIVLWKVLEACEAESCVVALLHQQSVLKSSYCSSVL